MKLKFKCIKESQYKYDQIIDRIKNELNELGVDNIETNGNLVSYENKFWKFGSNIKEMTKINKGCFDISTFDNAVRVKYTYYVSIFGDILLLICTLILGTFVHLFFYFICMVLFIQLIYRVQKIIDSNKNLLEKICSS